MNTKSLSPSLLAWAVIFFVGCAAPTANLVKISAFAPDDKLVVLPALGPADISFIVTSAVEKQLSAHGHEFVGAQKVREVLLSEGLLDEYQSFIEKQNSVGIVDSQFLSKLERLGNHFMIVKITDWAQGGNFLMESWMKSDLQRVIEASIKKVKAGETLVGLSASVYSIAGDLVYQDTSETKISNPMKTPSFTEVAEIAAWKFGKTLPK